MITVFSVANKPYLKYIDVLSASVKKYFPEANFLGCLVNCPDKDYGFDVRHIEHDKRMSEPNFCAGLRTKMFRDLLDEGHKTLIYVDADSCFIRSAKELIEHVNSCGVSMRPKSLEEGLFASGVITCNASKKGVRDFFESYRKNYQENINAGDWFSDQKMLNKTYQGLKNHIDFKPLPNKFCDVWFSDDGVLWTAKGITRGNNKFINKLKEFNYAG